GCLLFRKTAKPGLFGNVAGDFGRTDNDAGLIDDRRYRYRDQNLASVFTATPRFIVVDRLPGADPAEHAVFFSLKVVWNDDPDGPADRFGLGITEDSLRAAIPRQDGSIQVLRDYGRIRRGHDGGQ